MNIKRKLVYFLKKNYFLRKLYFGQIHLRYQFGINTAYPYYKMLKGDGIEVGAMSNPAIFKYAENIKYADVKDEQSLKENISKIKIDNLYKGEYVKVDITIPKDKPALNDVPDNSVDFVFSSHSLEHAPNPIDSLIDYYRVLRNGGIIYTVIPNKHNQYDRLRKETSIKKLIKKWEDKDYGYTLEEFQELFKNTVDHPLYHEKCNEEIEFAWNENTGIHHVYVYSEKNTLELIRFLTSNLKGCELTFFNSGWDIHFALTKNPSRKHGTTKAERQFARTLKIK